MNDGIEMKFGTHIERVMMNIFPGQFFSHGRSRRRQGPILAQNGPKIHVIEKRPPCAGARAHDYNFSRKMSQSTCTKIYNAEITLGAPKVGPASLGPEHIFSEKIILGPMTPRVPFYIKKGFLALFQSFPTILGPRAPFGADFGPFWRKNSKSVKINIFAPSFFSKGSPRRGRP